MFSAKSVSYEEQFQNIVNAFTDEISEETADASSPVGGKTDSKNGYKPVRQAEFVESSQPKVEQNVILDEKHDE